MILKITKNVRERIVYIALNTNIATIEILLEIKEKNPANRTTLSMQTDTNLKEKTNCFLKINAY